RSKMFCSCSTPTLESPPNTHVDPVCLGMPGVLPVINARAVDLTIMTGLALNCQIASEAKFDHKNYHYPDLMKGYQVSEYDLPICVNGWIDIEVGGETRRIGITRVHLEEDTARLQHQTDPTTGETYSLIDVNRAGLPLMEIVSEPDVRSAEEARAYLQKLRQILRYIGASRANMEEGNMRCEPNVSIRPVGRAEFGQKVELKNINSFKHAYDAIHFEEKRQAEVLNSGGKVTQETRGWREDTNQSVPQRTKEGAEDYRYFPEPDLPPLAISADWIQRIRETMPELPDAKRLRFQEQYSLSDYDARILTDSRVRGDFFEDTVAAAGAEWAKSVANWINGDFARLLNAANTKIQDSKITPDALAELIGLQEAGTISGKTAKDVFEQMFSTGDSSQKIVETQGLAQIESTDEVSAAIVSVIAANEKAVQDYRAGKDEAIKFLVGQVMKETRGRARPDVAADLLREKLGEQA
ncbi:MAG: Asp-tRNA(Asn)/Glu-tRNA(Gln) amidotransferase subunit GatB, partial [Dehalococcoidia bacterium]